MLVPRRSRVLDSHCGADVCSKLEAFWYPEAQCMLVVMAAVELAHWQLVSSDTVMRSVQFVCLYHDVSPVFCRAKLPAEHDKRGSTACLQT